MPQLGETVTEGTVTRWMKAVGDTITRDEPLFEVSTDKVDSEVPAPASGVLTEILVPEGDTVDVGTRLAVIGDGSAQPAPAAAPDTAEPEAPPPPPPPPGFVASGAAPLEAPVRPPAPEYVPPAEAPAPTPPVAAPSVAAPSVAAVAPPEAAGGAGESPGEPVDPRLLSPVVRRLLTDNGLDPAAVTGTGLGGRITREDVLAVIDERHAGTSVTPPAPSASTPPVAAPPPAPTAAPPVATPPAPPPPTAPVPAYDPAPSVGLVATGDRIVPFSNMRRRTAEHMVRSKATSPHAFIATEADFENVERVRRAWRDRFRAEEGYSLTYLPFVARATVEALRQFPNLNASVGEDALVIHQAINLGIAVDLDHEGLIVPVVHRAEEVTLRGMARRIRDLADRARTRQLRADDIAGGTFSITNDGPFGTYFTVPIINQPQVAILATDGVKRRPVVVTLPDGSESIAIHSTALIGVSWDHRAVDGAYVASFLGRITELLSTRDWAAEL
jgi:pyruvate dehydrogenase E2 component (dihydrolipoamide acetyltransferase)